MSDLLAFSSENCSVARTLATIGEKWTLLVLRDAFLGVRRFDDFRARSGAPRQVLGDRLHRLVDDGLMRRVPYQEPGHRQRYEYRLTRRGHDLFPVLVALQEYGDRYHADPAGPAVTLEHGGCGEPIHATVRCEAGHDVPSAHHVLARPGPGARLAM